MADENFSFDDVMAKGPHWCATQLTTQADRIRELEGGIARADWKAHRIEWDCDASNVYWPRDDKTAAGMDRAMEMFDRHDAEDSDLDFGEYLDAQTP